MPPLEPLVEPAPVSLELPLEPEPLPPELEPLETADASELAPEPSLPASANPVPTPAHPVPISTVYVASVPTVKDTTDEAPVLTMTLPAEIPSTDTA